MENKKLTNEVGAPVAENEHSLTAGPRGPVMLQDVWLLEKLAHFDRRSSPSGGCTPRAGAPTATSPSPTTSPNGRGRRSSSRAPRPTSSSGFPPWPASAARRDAERDIRGVAVKFYTEEGNWDLVGNNTPTFFLRDVHNFPLTSTAQSSAIPAPACAPPRTTGTSGRCCPRPSTRPPSSCRTGASPRPSGICTSSGSTPSPSTTRRTSGCGANSTSRPSRASKT